MRICILSKDNAPIGFLDNEAPKATHFNNDILHTYLKGTAHTFEMTVPTDDDVSYLTVGNKLSFIRNGKSYYMTIMSTTQNEFYIDLTAYSLSFELLNEKARAYTAASAMSFEQYITAFGFERDDLIIGVNEVTDKRIKHEWTGETDSVLARLFSLASVFGAEIEFIPVLNDNYSLKHIQMNIYREHSEDDQGIGEKRDDMVIRYATDIEGITKTQDVTELYTGIRPYGTDGLSLTGYAATEVMDDDGNVEYFHPENSPAIYAPLARDRFPATSIVGSGDRYIFYDWQTDYSTAAALYGNALAKLKDMSKPKTTYEICGYVYAEIGDVVRIADESFSPPLYLQARVTEQEISTTDCSRNRTVFDSVLELENEIDDSLVKRMEKLTAATEAAQEAAEIARQAAENVKDGEDAVLLRISSSRGNVFKNNAVSTVLSVTIFCGSERITNVADLKRVFGNGAYLQWYWQRFGEESYGTISRSDVRLSNEGFSFELTPADVDVKVTFECQLML